VLCFHHNDHDGRCSASIVSRWNKRREQPNELRFIEMDYKLPVPVGEIMDGETVFVVDFSFEPDDMKQVRQKAGNVIWIDHHKTAEEYGYDDLDGLRDFSDKGPSGCELCWMHLFPDEPMPDIVRLIGDYDAWRLKMEPECYHAFEGMKMEDTEPESATWAEMLDGGGDLDKILTQGQSAIKYRDNYCTGISDSHGYETEIDGEQAYAMNMYGFGSNCFGSKMEEYSVCICYIHDGQQYTCSVYSETVDVSKIAKNHGGGGHKGAAGFVCDELPFKKTTEAGSES